MNNVLPLFASSYNNINSPFIVVYFTEPLRIPLPPPPPPPPVPVNLSSYSTSYNTSPPSSFPIRGTITDCGRNCQTSSATTNTTTINNDNTSSHSTTTRTTDHSTTNIYSFHQEREKQQQELQHEIPLPSTFQPSKYTVICGRGKKYSHSPGNKNLKHLIASKSIHHKYANAKSRNEKINIVTYIMSIVQTACGGPVGAFVKYETTSHKWIQVDGGTARDKVSSVIRDCLETKYKSSAKSKKQKRRFEKWSKQQKELMTRMMDLEEKEEEEEVEKRRKCKSIISPGGP